MPNEPASISAVRAYARRSTTVLQPSPPWQTDLPGKPCTTMSIS